LICAALVVDPDGAYDPRIVNGRLLLGLKGTMSEYELSWMRQRGIARRSAANSGSCCRRAFAGRRRGIMAAKGISVKKYVVRLSGEERERLEALIRKGKSPAQRLLKARVLLKADISEPGEGWSDSRIIKALETSASMVYRVRKQRGGRF
jgi:hypothetical protein